MEVQPLLRYLVIYQGVKVIVAIVSVDDKVSGESLEGSTLSGGGWFWCKKRTKNQLVESVFCLSAAVLR